MEAAPTGRLHLRAAASPPAEAGARGSGAGAPLTISPRGGGALLPLLPPKQTLLLTGADSAAAAEGLGTSKGNRATAAAAMAAAAAACCIVACCDGGGTVAVGRGGGLAGSPAGCPPSKPSVSATADDMPASDADTTPKLAAAVTAGLDANGPAAGNGNRGLYHWPQAVPSPPMVVLPLTSPLATRGVRAWPLARASTGAFAGAVAPAGCAHGDRGRRAPKGRTCSAALALQQLVSRPPPIASPPMAAANPSPSSPARGRMAPRASPRNRRGRAGVRLAGPPT